MKVILYKDKKENVNYMLKIIGKLVDIHVRASSIQSRIFLGLPAPLVRDILHLPGLFPQLLHISFEANFVADDFW